MNLTHKILIIDAHPVYAKKMEAFFRGLTFSEIVIASDAAEGLRMFGNAPADLVLLSGMLPDADSPQICRTLRTRAGASLKIIIQVGLMTEQDQVEQFLQDGADRVLVRKEKDLRPLQQAVEELLFSRQVVSS